MGSVTSLSLGNLEIDWGKNFNHINHAPLFIQNDLKEINQPYFDESDYEQIVIEKHKAFAAPLKDILPRLELLGYTVNSAKQLYYDPVKKGYIKKGEITPFGVFFSTLIKLNIKDIPLSYEFNDDYDPGEFTRSEIMKILKLYPEDKEIYNFPSNYSMGEFLEMYDPWAILRLLAENKSNLDIPVIWNIQETLGNGYFSENDITAPLSEEFKFIIVTEGSSDTHIIKRALEILRPKILDFFTFIDMEKGYPFTGIGNLHNFCKGLTKIGVLNKILVIYDSDTEGLSKYKEVQNLKLPSNMKIMILPSMSEFKKFRTLGPTGSQLEDINKKAVAIECFLDLSWETSCEPVVRWTSYNTKLDTYQGELENKVSYTKKFLAIHKKESTYDYSKIEKLISTIHYECSEISSAEVISKYDQFNH